MKHQLGLWLSAVAACWPARASADESAFVATQASTTIVSRPATGSMSGPRRDATVGIGIGRSIRRSMFVELDACATFVDGDDVAIAAVPGIGWAFHPSFYAAFRTTIPADDPFDVTLAPGVGARRALDDAIDVFAELNLIEGPVLDEPDIGVALTLGATVGL